MQYKIASGDAVLCTHEKEEMDIVEILEDTSEDVFLKDNGYYSAVTGERPTSNRRFIIVDNDELDDLLKHDVEIHNVSGGTINAVRSGKKVFAASKVYFDDFTYVDYLGGKSTSDSDIAELRFELDLKLREAMEIRSKLNAANRPIKVYELEEEGWELIYNEKGDYIILSPDKIRTYGDNSFKYILLSGLVKGKRTLIARGFSRFIKENSDEHS